MRHIHLLQIPQTPIPSYEVSQTKNNASILEDKSNNLRIYVGNFSDLDTLDPQELKSLDCIYLGSDSNLGEDWYTLEEHIYFEENKKDGISELTAFTNILKKYPNIHEVRIPICALYKGMYFNGVPNGDYIDLLFNEIDKLPSLTTLHINWTEFWETNRKKLIEKISKNPHLHEVHLHHSIYVNAENIHTKKISPNDISHLNKLREVPESERPEEWSNEIIASFIQTGQIVDAAIRHLKDFYKTKQPMSPDLAYSIKKLFEVPLYDELVNPLADCVRARQTDLKIFLHGIRVDENQSRFLMQAIDQSNHVSIYAQNTRLAPMQQNSVYLISRNKSNDAVQQDLTPAEKQKFHFF